MARVFISYRPDDSAQIAERIYDRLLVAFGQTNVFKDAYELGPDEDLRKAIRRNMGRCEATLIIIGNQWLTVTGEHDVRLLDDPDDPVRTEVEVALEQADKYNMALIPLLVDGALLPTPNELPDSLTDLANRHHTQVNNATFEADMSQLIEQMNKVVTGQISGVRAIMQSSEMPEQLATISDLDSSPSLSQTDRTAMLYIIGGGVGLVLLILLILTLSGNL